MNSSNQKNPLIVVAGNMSVGKTTLTELIKEKLGFPTLVESFADNPYLADFFQDMKKWAFLSQMHFLNERKKQVQQITERTNALVLDRSVYEDFSIFASNLHNKGYISDDNFELYKHVYKKIVDMLPHPNLFIFLNGSLEHLIERTKRRGRGFEEQIDVKYLNELNELYKKWAKNLEQTFPHSKVLRIDTDSLNYADNKKDAEAVIQKIKDALQ